MLLHEFDESTRAVINPADILAPVPGMPKVMVSCFASVTFEQMLALLDAQPIAASKTANMTYPVYRAEVEGVPIALQMAGVGAPVCVGNLEEVFAMGWRRSSSLATAACWTEALPTAPSSCLPPPCGTRAPASTMPRPRRKSR